MPQNALGPRLDSKLPYIPSKLLPQLIHMLESLPNDTTVFSKPYIRPSLRASYPYIVAGYVVVILCGTVLNLCMIAKIVSLSKCLRRKHYPTMECNFLASVAVLNVLMCLAVMPLSLAIMLVQNWVFGRFLCYVAPVLQDVPLYGGLVCLLGHTTLRYRSIVRILGPETQSSDGQVLPGQPASRRPRKPPVWPVLLVWLLVAVAVAPQAGHIQYYDLQRSLGQQWGGVGLCSVDDSRGMVIYKRVLLVIMYVAPLAAGGLLLYRTRVYLLGLPDPAHPDGCDRASRVEECSGRPSFNSKRNLEPPHPQCTSQLSFRSPGGEKSPTYDTISGLLELPLTETSTPVGPRGIFEKKIQLRLQNYFCAITAAYGLCLLPLMVLRLLRSVTPEVVAAEDLDAVLVSMVWVALMQSVTTAALYVTAHSSLLTAEVLELLSPRGSLRTRQDVQDCAGRPAHCSSASLGRSSEVYAIDRRPNCRPAKHDLTTRNSGPSVVALRHSDCPAHGSKALYYQRQQLQHPVSSMDNVWQAPAQSSSVSPMSSGTKRNGSDGFTPDDSRKHLNHFATPHDSADDRPQQAASEFHHSHQIEHCRTPRSSVKIISDKSTLSKDFDRKAKGHRNDAYVQSKLVRTSF